MPFTVSAALRPPPGYWCAAGDVVIRTLGTTPATRFCRASAQPVRDNGMSFSVSSVGALAWGLNLFSARNAGLSAASAQVECTNSLDDPLFGN